MTVIQAAAPAVFPFTALVGQSELQRALLLTAVDPGIGGVLIGGPRGTAKSTAARALAALLPGAPFVSLPLSASLEQLVGTLNVEDVLRDGQVRLSPGLVARAHGGVLYVDEVNLLPDVLVDALLDVAASGVNIVERDGISQQHAARFVLVGTMNPEEGELRPQLLDRFGLSVMLENPRDPAQRHAILRTRLQFDEHPQTLLDAHAARLAELGEQLTRARAALTGLAWSDEVVAHAAAMALDAGVDGVRADLVMLRAARALAALERRGQVTTADIDAVSDLALAHRRTESGGAPSGAAQRPQQEQASGGQHQPSPDSPAKPALGSPAEPASGSPADAARGSSVERAPGSSAKQGLGSPVERAQASGGQRQPSPSSPADPAREAEGDWGAMPPEPVATTRVVSTGAWPAKKA